LAGNQNATIKIQTQIGAKAYSVHPKFPKSECPTPKSLEIEQRIAASNQQKFFTRKSSNQAQVQNIQMTGLGSASHHVQASLHLNSVGQQPQTSATISRQVVQSQGHSRRQSGRSNDFVGNGSVQHVSSKVKSMIPEQSTYEARNGYSNRSKIMGTSYHASSLSFSKNPKLGSKQTSATIHQTYNGTGLHSHNSSIHSSHMKTRSPGNSQLGTIQNSGATTGIGAVAPQMLLNPGTL